MKSINTLTNLSLSLSLSLSPMFFLLHLCTHVLIGKYDHKKGFKSKFTPQKELDNAIKS